MDCLARPATPQLCRDRPNPNGDLATRLRICLVQRCPPRGALGAFRAVRLTSISALTERHCGMSGTRTAMAWSMAERYLGLVIGLTASMILARLLTPTDVGLFSLCAAVLAVAATIREFGISEYIIQEKSLDNDKLRRAYAVAVLTAWPIGVVVLLLRHAVASHYDQPELAHIIQVLALNFFLLPLATPAYALLTRELRFRALLFVHTGSGLAGALTSITLAYLGHGAISLAWGAVATVAAQVVGVTIARPRSSFLLPSLNGIGPIFRFGSTLVSGRIIESTTNNAHEFIIAHYFGFAAVGLFSRAKGLVDIFHSSVTVAVARVATPDMAAALRNNQSLAATFARGTSIFTALSWSFCGYVALTAHELILLMFGSQWGGSAPLGTLLAMAMLPTPLFALCGSVLAASGLVRRRLVIALRWCPAHIAVVVVGAHLGLAWIAGLWFVTNAVIAAASAYEVRRALHTTFVAMYASSVRSIPVATASVTSQAAVLLAGRALGLHALALLVLTLAAGLLAFFFVAAATKHAAFNEFTRLARRLFVWQQAS